MRTHHPAEEMLHRMVDDELDQASRSQIQNHLRYCLPCRNTVRELRQLSRAARALRTPRLRPDARQRFRDVLDRGEVPGSHAAASHARPAPQPWRRWVMLGVVTLGSFLGAPALTRPAASSFSTLTFGAAHASPGDHLATTYVGAGRFALAESLTVRARVRRAGQPAWDRAPRHVALGTLYRDHRGRFRGTITVPPDAAHLVLAVETVDGAYVDHRGRRGWELLTYEDTQPTLESLTQRWREYAGRDWQVALESAALAVQLYPGEPMAWVAKHLFTQRIHGTVPDSVDRVHRAALADIEHAVERGEATVQSGDMYLLGATLGDSAAAARWQPRMLAELPTVPAAADFRARKIMESLEAHESYPALEKLEALWKSMEPGNLTVAQVGITASEHMGNPAALALWGNRLVALQPALRDYVAETFMRWPMLQDSAIGLLSASVDDLREPTDDLRPLHLSRPEYKRRSAASLRRAMVRLGRALVETGQTRRGLPFLDLAVDGGWDVEVFQTAARARLQVGDSSGAAELAARIAVDRAIHGKRPDSLLTLVRQAGGTVAWTDRLTRAWDRMHRETLAESEAVSGEFDSIELQDIHGDRVTLADHLGAAPGVLVFLSRTSAPAMFELAMIDTLATALTDSGARMVVIVPEAPSVDFRQFVDSAAAAVTWMHDTWARAAQILGAWSTPDYFVIGPSRQRQFRNSAPDDVLRQVAVLQESPRIATLLAP